MISSKDQITAAPRVFTIHNIHGMEAGFCDHGARITRLLVPSVSGKVDVVLGFQDPRDYITSTDPYFGVTIGRYANRIANGRFSLNGTAYQLPLNDGPNTLHSGVNGFHRQVWKCSHNDESSVSFELLSPSGISGFPGNMKVIVKYILTDQNELRIEYQAVTDKTTVINLTNHAYFNLNGEGSGSVLDHVLQVNADHFVPVNENLIPTGNLMPVKDTPFDFLKFEKVGSRIENDHEQLKVAGGYDHSYVLMGEDLKQAAIIVGDKSHIRMEVYTTEPAMQFYSGNFMQGKNRLRSGPDDKRTAFCLETQHFPDSPNHDDFPSTVLQPGNKYNSYSIYKFS